MSSKQNIIYTMHIIRQLLKKNPLGFTNTFNGVQTELGHVSMADVTIAHNKLIETGQLSAIAGGLYELTAVGAWRVNQDLEFFRLCHL